MSQSLLRLFKIILKMKYYENLKPLKIGLPLILLRTKCGVVQDKMWSSSGQNVESVQDKVWSQFRTKCGVSSGQNVESVQDKMWSRFFAFTQDKMWTTRRGQKVRTSLLVCPFFKSCISPFFHYLANSL